MCICQRVTLICKTILFVYRPKCVVFVKPARQTKHVAVKSRSYIRFMFITSKSNQFFTFAKRMKWVRAQRSLVIRFWRAVSSETAQIGESWLLKWVMRVGCVSRGKALGAGDRWRESWLTGDFHKWNHNLIMSPRKRYLLRLDLNVRVSLFSPVTLSPDLGIRRQFYTFREKRVWLSG